jgi:tRNA(Ile)-lysidine synthase
VLPSAGLRVPWFHPLVVDAAPVEPLVARVRAALERWPPPADGARVVVAFSGGVDSTVLLASLARLPLRVPLRAVHVDHGLHPDSALWSAHCAQAARELGVELLTVRVAVEHATGSGLEAAAREARYAGLAGLLSPGDVLLTAHHGDDQLETVLLRLVRGSGVRGLRAIRDRAPFAGGWLARPLLGFTRAELVEHARAWNLRWLEDPANSSLEHDRNFLRATVVPRLVERWPAAARSAQRLAEQMADAEQILEEVAARDAASVAEPSRVSRAVLEPLDPARQRNLLRHLLRRCGFELPSAHKIEELRIALLGTRRDAQPRVRWPGAEARVFRGHLYLMSVLPAASVRGFSARLDKRGRWTGPEGELAFEPLGTGPGLPESWLDDGLMLRFRGGGEAFKPLARAHHRSLKHWLQEAAIVPWMRTRIPLLYRHDDVVAVGDLWLADQTRAAGDEPRWRVLWSNHPPLT